MPSNKSDLTIRVPMLYDDSFTKLDPLNVVYLDDAILLRNLYGQLIDVKHDGQLTAGVAERFSVEERVIRFEFGSRVKTIDGIPITAQDAELTLKRVILNKGSGHGDIRQFICPGHKLASIDSHCPGIRTEGNTLILEVTHEHLAPMLLLTLESSDFSILPASSLKIIDGKSVLSDYRNTSGAYYVERDFVDKVAILKANPNHYRYRKDMPQIIELHSAEIGHSVPAFLAGEYDVVTTAEPHTEKDLQQVLNQPEKFNVHETLPLKITLCSFSPKALQDFSPEQRFYAAEKIGQAYYSLLRSTGDHPTNAFFPKSADGGLTEEQSRQISQMRNSVGRPRFHRPVCFAPYPALFHRFKEQLAAFPEINVIERPKEVANQTLNFTSDVYLTRSDFSYIEEYALLGYYIKKQIFNLPNFDADNWLINYVATERKDDRLNLLNQFHFEMLKTASIVPISSSPYHAIATNQWRFEMSRMVSRTLFCELSKI